MQLVIQLKSVSDPVKQYKRRRELGVLYMHISTKASQKKKKMLHVLARVAKWTVHVEIRWQPNEGGIEKAGHE